MKTDFANALKGFAMGAANVVPGVSGGTIAFITGIYERLIEALKSFDMEALKLASRFKIAELWEKVDGRFLASIFIGSVLALGTLASLLKWGLEHHETHVFALFFGLIAASIPSVGKMIEKWTLPVLIVFFIGLSLAVSLAFLKPASENDHPLYLGLCGVVAMCSMIIPGLSGSFVLLLMGNYELIMLDAINDLRSGNFGEALPILIPVGIGAVVGLLVLSRFLSWLFKTHHDTAIGAITGFVAGSLVIIWPWKEIHKEQFIKASGEIKEKIVKVDGWRLPDFSQAATWSALLALVLGVGLILIIERFAKVQPEPSDERS